MALKEDSTAITFTEVDEVNHPTATYIYSEPAAGPARPEQDKKHRENWGRVDVAPLGVGVGNADASPTAALLLHILQDSSGRIATILFAHRVGTALEPECKMYRLAADVFNDLAMILDCLSPMIPAGAPRVTVLSTAGVLRALCGVAGGSSKASLSAHFSRWGNLAEVNAVGSFVVSRVTSFSTTWICLLMLLALHLSLNYAAVRSVQMTSLNRQRANIVFSTLLNTDPDVTQLLHPESTKQQQQQQQQSHQPPSWKTLTPAHVSKQEKIFETDGILRWSSSTMTPPQTLGYCRIGISLQQFLSTSALSTTSSKSLRTPIPMPQLTTLFNKEDYILYLTSSSNSSSSSKKTPTWHANILLKNTTTSQSQLKAWAHALLAARVLSTSSAAAPAAADFISTSDQIEATMDVLHRTLEFLNEGSRFDRYTTVLTDNGWDLNIAALETRSGRRVVV
ncbi:DUF647 domain protein [Aspergillus luchuensis]|uniref:DUF647 domain protein n=1 Tax=Aspergillus kawachii TaxID=1069201 RepID=A0A146F6J3_ASPKA|nr:DUF647 domain protein [Aspergillus luchuensis]